MSSKDERVTVRAWVAAGAQAKQVTPAQIEQLQAVFDRQLGVEHRQDGTIVIYSSDEATAKRLEQIMTILCIFREQRVYVDDGRPAD